MSAISSRHHATCTGAILAGGGSTRMGRAKHQMVLRDGRTMLEAVSAALAEVCTRLVIVGRPIPEAADGFDHVADLRPGAGPLGGIEALLASGIDSQYLVAPCDVPLISAELLSMLLTDANRTPASVFHRPRTREEFDPLPARIVANALPLATKLLDQGERAVWRLMGELDPEVIEVPPHLAWQLQNINTPAHYEALLARGSLTQVIPSAAPRANGRRQVRPSRS